MWLSPRYRRAVLRRAGRGGTNAAFREDSLGLGFQLLFRHVVVDHMNSGPDTDGRGVIEQTYRLGDLGEVRGDGVLDLDGGADGVGWILEFEHEVEKVFEGCLPVAGFFGGGNERLLLADLQGVAGFVDAASAEAEALRAVSGVGDDPGEQFQAGLAVLFGA